MGDTYLLECLMPCQAAVHLRVESEGQAARRDENEFNPI